MYYKVFSVYEIYRTIINLYRAFLNVVKDEFLCAYIHVRKSHICLCSLNSGFLHKLPHVSSDLVRLVPAEMIPERVVLLVKHKFAKFNFNSKSTDFNTETQNVCMNTYGWTLTVHSAYSYPFDVHQTKLTHSNHYTLPTLSFGHQVFSVV